jgi:hypothetical protein
MTAIGRLATVAFRPNTDVGPLCFTVRSNALLGAIASEETRVTLERQPRDGALAQRCEREDAIDADSYNRILWRGLMGNRPYPERRGARDADD